MLLTIKQVGNKFVTYKAAPDGTPTGEPIDTFATLELARGVVGAAAKCWDEMGAEYVYVPWSATTLKEALEAQAAQERSEEVSEVAQMHKKLVDRILENPEVKDKGKALISIATEFAAWLEMPEPEEKKSAPVMTETVTDHSVIKSIGGDRIGGYAILWGNEDKRDLTKQFFTQKTAELTTIFDAVGKLPWLYQHAMDGTVKTKVGGVVDTLKTDSIGLWYEAQLKLADEYDEYIKKLLEAGRLKTSSQTFPVAFEYNKSTGEITRWPIVEITGTPTPAEYRMPAIEILKTHYADIGVSDFAAVENYSHREEPNQQGAEKARLELELARLQLI